MGSKVRKTDDKIILQMLKEGKTQKEIAEHFGVSPVAICKRIKRLKPDLSNLTEKEQKFAIAVAEGENKTQAALKSYEVTSLENAKTMGKRLMNKPAIQAAITELMEYHGMGRSYRVKKLKTHVDNPDPNVSLKALDQSWKLDGSYAPEEKVNIDIDVKQVSLRLEEIRNMKSQLEEQIFQLSEGDVIEAEFEEKE